MRCVFCVLRDFTDWFCEAAVRGDHGRSGFPPPAVAVRVGDSARDGALGDRSYRMCVSMWSDRSQQIGHIHHSRLQKGTCARPWWMRPADSATPLRLGRPHMKQHQRCLSSRRVPCRIAGLEG